MMAENKPITLAVPTKAEVNRWLSSETGEFVARTMFGILLMQHGFDEGFEFGLSHLYVTRYLGKYGKSKLEALSPWEWMEWCDKEMPIQNIRHAAYYPPEGTEDFGLLVLSKPNECLYPRERTTLEKKVTKIEKREPFRKEQKVLVGMTFQIKENGWNFFLPDWVGSRFSLNKNDENRIRFVEGLKGYGYMLVLALGEQLPRKSGQTPPRKYKLVNAKT